MEENREPVPAVEASAFLLDGVIAALREHAKEVRGQRAHYHRVVDTYANGIENAISYIEQLRARQTESPSAQYEWRVSVPGFGLPYRDEAGCRAYAEGNPDAVLERRALGPWERVQV